jgi:hypothetical protein
MKNNIIKISLMLFVTVLVSLTGCKQEEYKFGDIKSPANLTLTAVVAGVGTGAPAGDGTGSVQINTAANNVITYKIDFGDGNIQFVPSGVIKYKYTTPGTGNYTITATAIGTGGVTSTLSTKVTVFVAFVIPTAIIDGLTGTTAKVWITDNLAPGHVGVGPAAKFTPDYYAATPNQRDACLYDDEITFTRDANNNITMSVDNKGASSLIGAATVFYGFPGGDGCYAVNTGGTKKLNFMNATSGSTAAVSTQIQFAVPGNGIINFGTGGTTYEILSITATTVSLRNIGIDGNAWYQKLKVK